MKFWLIAFLAFGNHDRQVVWVQARDSAEALVKATQMLLKEGFFCEKIEVIRQASNPNIPVI